MTTFRWVVCGAVVSVSAFVLQLQTVSAQGPPPPAGPPAGGPMPAFTQSFDEAGNRTFRVHVQFPGGGPESGNFAGPPEAGSAQPNVVWSRGARAVHAAPNQPLPEAMSGGMPGMPGGPMGMAGGMGMDGGPMGMAGGMGMGGGPMHGGMGGGMPMHGAMGGGPMGMGGPMHGAMSGAMPMHGGAMGMGGGMPGMPHPPAVDSDTLGLCVKAMLLNFQYGSVEMVAPLFKTLPPEAQREFLGQALKIVGESDFDSFDAARRKTLGAAPEHANDAAAYRKMIDSREQRVRQQVVVLAQISALLVAPPQQRFAPPTGGEPFAHPPMPHAIQGKPFAPTPPKFHAAPAGRPVPPPPAVIRKSGQRRYR